MRHLKVSFSARAHKITRRYDDNPALSFHNPVVQHKFDKGAEFR
jgi:hypothetical protein